MIRLTTFGLALVLATGCQPVVPGTPGTTVTTTTLPALDRLTVEPADSMAGYSRAKFPHWSVGAGGCDTREAVLKRQGTSVTTGKGCEVTGGTWHSPYDDKTHTDPGGLDVDHVVPLAEAWRSGANSWTTQKRKDFANDLGRPQLLAVTDSVNQGKGDKDPAAWKPQHGRCKYAQDWIAVKAHWGLSVDPAEKAALTTMLRSC